MTIPEEGLPSHPDPAARSRLQRAGDWVARQANGVFGYVLLRVFLLYESTLEIYAVGTECLHRAKGSGRPVLVTLWHGKGLLPICYLENQQLCLYASHTREPETYARSVNESVRGLGLHLMQGFGYRIVDASLFKSEAHGVVKYIHELKSAPGGVIAPDGPAGPACVAKPGAAYIAARAGAIILPVGAAISRGVELDQWDRFEVPKPFARCALAFGQPMDPPAKATEADLAGAAASLQGSLERQVERAAALLKSLE
ncbi:MAG: hypothetical protein ACREJQ_04215 [bacterium]